MIIVLLYIIPIKRINENRYLILINDVINLRFFFADSADTEADEMVI